MLRNLVGLVLLAAAALTGPASAQNLVAAGTLTCDVSAGIGMIVGSRRTVNCTFAPSLPGPVEYYTGTITKLGVDIGVTTGGVMVWLVYAPTIAPDRRACRFVRRCDRRGDVRGRARRQCADRRLQPHRRAAAGVGAGPDRIECGGRSRRTQPAICALTPNQA